MTKRFELIIFDWDGTLIDSEANIVCCMQTAMADLGFPVRPAEDIRNIIGLGLQESLMTLYPGSDVEFHAKLVDRYRYHFLTSDPSQPFEGIDSVLKQLLDQQYLLAVATGKGRLGLKRALDHTGYGRLFHATRCADETRSKPHPQMLMEILDELGVEPDKALMIGDTEYDLMMAKNANVASLAVCYGVHEKQRLLQCEPLSCVESMYDIFQYLNPIP